MVSVAEKILMSLKMTRPTEAGSGVGGDRLILRCQGDIQVQISRAQLQNWKESGVEAVVWGILSKTAVTKTAEVS